MVVLQQTVNCPVFSDEQNTSNWPVSPGAGHCGHLDAILQSVCRDGYSKGFRGDV